MDELVKCSLDHNQSYMMLSGSAWLMHASANHSTSKVTRYGETFCQVEMWRLKIDIFNFRVGRNF